MKKLFIALFLMIACFLFVGCSTGTDGSKENNEKEQGEKKNDDKEPSKGAYVAEFKTDWIELATTSNAYEDWYAKKYYYDVKFDKDGKCTDYTTTYELIDASYYEDSNDRLESGNYKPVWNSEKTQFTNSRSHNYTEVEDIYESWDNDYLPYTVYYSDNTSKRYEVPSQAQKDADLLKNLGISVATLTQGPAKNPTVRSQTQTSISVFFECDDLNIDKLNAFGLAVYNAIKEIADGGIMYDYIEYTPIEECPQIENSYSSLYFMYKFNSVKINLSTSIYTNWDTGEKFISIAVAKSAWN